MERDRTLHLEPADAVVLFGVTGDLAYRKIFPALLALAERGRLNVPVIGVARAGWDLAQLQDRARESAADFVTDVDAKALEHLTASLRYVDGDYNDPATFQRLCATLGRRQTSSRSTSPFRRACSPRS